MTTKKNPSFPDAPEPKPSTGTSAPRGSDLKKREPLPSTTLEDIARADGEGMAPVPPPRPDDAKPREEKSSRGN